MGENTELEMELLSIVRDEYASLETITQSRWPDHSTAPSDEELVRVLRELQARDLVQCYRYTPQEYVPLDEFEDEAAENIWWLITEAGMETLSAQNQEIDAREEGRER